MNPKMSRGEKNAHADPRAVALTRDTTGRSNGRGLSKLPTQLHSAQSSKPKRLPMNNLTVAMPSSAPAAPSEQRVVRKAVFEAERVNPPAAVG